MDHGPNRANIDTSASGSQDKGGTRLRDQQSRTSPREPAVESPLRGWAIRNRPLLRSLAQDAHRAPRGVDIIDIEPDELTHAHTSRIEHLQDQSVSDVEGITIVGGDQRDIHQSRRLCLFEDTRESSMSARGGEAVTGIGLK